MRRIDKEEEDSKSDNSVKAKTGWKTKKNSASNAGIVKRMANEVEGKSIKERNNFTQMK